MSESKNYLIKQVWRQKGDVSFDRIPFKEEDKAAELSQTTYPVLLLETKTNGGAGAIFAIGRVTEATVIEEAVEFDGMKGEYTYHVPFRYEFVLEHKKSGITREELQELTGQKFAPQVKGGLYEIEASVFEQLSAMLKERDGGAAAPAATKAPAAPKKETKAAKQEAPKAKASAAGNTALADALAQAQAALTERPELRLVFDEGKVSYFPALLLEATSDLVDLQEKVNEYVSAGGNASLDEAAREAAAAGTAATNRYAKVIGLAEKLVREGRYESVQVPTLQKAFYREAKLPNPYLAIELQGPQGHHVLGADGTLYTAEGKTVQHFLGL